MLVNKCIAYIVCIFILGDVKYFSSHNNNDTIVIMASLKAGERLGFAYIDNNYENKFLEISNPGNRDTILLKRVIISSPTLFTYAFMTTVNNKDQRYVYSFLANPTDTILISMENSHFLKISDNKKIVTDTSDLFYTSFYFPKITRTVYNRLDAKKKQILSRQFVDNLTKGYTHQLSKIENEFLKNSIDKTQYSNKLFYAKQFYYSALYLLLYTEHSTLDKVIYDKLRSSTDSIINLINNKNLFLSYPYVENLQAYIEIKVLQNTKKSNYATNIYNTSLKLLENKQTEPLILYYLRTSRFKSDANIKNIITDFCARFPKNKQYIDSLFNSNNNLEPVRSDTLMNLNKRKFTLDTFLNDTSHTIVLDFWASWCAPCRELFPHFDSVKTILKNHPITFISVNLDENEDDWVISSDALKQHLRYNNYHLINPKKSGIVKKMRINAIPRIIVIKNKKIIASDFFRPNEIFFVKELLNLTGRK